MFGRKKKNTVSKEERNTTSYIVETEKEKETVAEVESAKSATQINVMSDSDAIEQVEEIAPKEPDNMIDVDVMNVKNLQIGYQAESIFMKKSPDDQLHIYEYIGYTAYEYLGKVTANRFKTTIRYGRREEVNRKTYVEIYLPDAWRGELTISSQYGHISSEEDWCMERLTMETNEGNITLKTIEAPRIRMVSPNGSILVEHTIGFTDLHCMTGAIVAHQVDGGAKLETSTGPIEAKFTSVNNVLECNTLSGDIYLTVPQTQGLKVDGISKRGNIESSIEALTITPKPGNVKNISGMLGEKPFFDVKLSTINGNIVVS